MEETKKIFKKHLENRKTLLLKIYELSRGTSGIEVSYSKAFEKISSYSDHVEATSNYLVNEGLIEIIDKEFKDLRITHEGIKAVEQFMSEEKATMTSVIKNKFWVL